MKLPSLLNKLKSLEAGTPMHVVFEKRDGTKRCMVGLFFELNTRDKQKMLYISEVTHEATDKGTTAFLTGSDNRTKSIRPESIIRIAIGYHHYEMEEEAASSFKCVWTKGGVKYEVVVSAHSVDAAKQELKRTQKLNRVPSGLKVTPYVKDSAQLDVGVLWEDRHDGTKIYRTPKGDYLWRKRSLFFVAAGTTSTETLTAKINKNTDVDSLVAAHYRNAL